MAKIGYLYRPLDCWDDSYWKFSHSEPNRRVYQVKRIAYFEVED